MLHALQQRNIYLQGLYPPLDFAVGLNLADGLAHFAEARAMLRAERSQKNCKTTQSYRISVDRLQTFTRDIITTAQSWRQMGYKIPEIADMLKVSAAPVCINT